MLTCSCLLRSSAALALVLGLAPPALAERSHPVETPEVLTSGPGAVLRNTAWSLDPPALYLAPRAEVDFLEERRALMAALARTEPDTIDRARAVTDLAEFHFAHGLAPEGLSLLANLKDADLPPVHRLRAAAFELALGLIDPRDLPLTDRAAALLGPDHVDWPDQVLFVALNAARTGDHDTAGPLLEDATDRLARFPAAVQERVLPAFLESAIATEQWRLARDLAAAFDDFAGLHDSPAYHFLLGQAAETGDDAVAAFDAYVRAMNGRDLWAHRARRSLVDLGLRRQALTTGEAARLLAIEAELWRGDDSALEVMDDLASLQMVEGDRIAAIETYGRISAAAPNSPQAAEARQKARTLISRLYERGTTGQIPLAEFMAAHNRIARLYRFDMSFADAAETYADRFDAIGATQIAAEEYGLIRDYLAVAADLGLGDLAPDRLAGITVKQAQTLLAGGQFDRLGRLLEEGFHAEDPALKEAYDLVAARYYAETGQSARIVAGEGGEGASPQRLAIRAQAFFDAGLWNGAEAAYARLWGIQGDEMAFSDAVNFLLSAYRNGNMAQTAALAEEFPKLTDLPGWAEIAQGLTERAPELLPLRQDTARARIDQVDHRMGKMPDVARTE
ncbi:hypothetical protein [Pseudooceanicola sp. LIPI14-2-Ac024]|uniref:hypothetical protein n=1 Tax=Pseudooceanicola sp. LIPI14-2-Ac024 TaxID=3344875 RepID=UPI0035CED660